ncbi:ribosomal subunit interface protein [Clostridium thermosuccinogenes]|uniref:Ribosome hibernation promoting factor n=1 Tax=Clostridium thermosuccinogenes TaxID=84032 RepID=A0A2K2FDK8_9CLOT|nr:ribosome-associated translation inhibitor RaiA [Pseudoclostridium thermosuccinogenes]AUS98178.1 ribosomal subunit interface protein [Pseudoclostridium thermosuccinogenes]PNT91167.1 ribosomal subunit interface protein [Pseudoclostridium thermosuccinogenes]PNT96844.1 ribosomal subunit interface protein [Pseudoclostridium thermosuccinogenes]PNT98654.1 ribosomal subunit interface protein [Pseudoclostridium thermosuccinogenes]
MKFIVSGKNIEVTEALRDRAIKKLSRLERFFSPETEAHVTLSVEKIRQIVEVTIPYKGMIFRAEVANEDMYASIDKAIDILERQIRKNKTRLEKKLRDGAFVAGTVPANTEAAVEEESEFKIVRSKKFAIKPMDVEEAILQMNLLGHEFFVFSNADTNLVNVVYRRKDGNYGLIEPEY